MMRPALPTSLRAALIGLLWLLGACSAPQVAYNNADTLLRFRLYGYIDPTQEQDVMMTTAIKRLHAWHRRYELAGYAEMLGDLAQRLETGLSAADIAEVRESADARYRRLAERAVDEALPVLRTFTPRNLEALRTKFEERNDEYADDYLDGDAAERLEAMVERLAEHVERWVDDLTPAQIAHLEAVAARHPRFAELQLENRRHLQARFLDAVSGIMSGDPQAEARLRDLVVNWERHSLPQYRELLTVWEADFRGVLLAIERSLSPQQRRETVARLRQYSNDLYALTDGDAPKPSNAAQADLAAPVR